MKKQIHLLCLIAIVAISCDPKINKMTENNQTSSENLEGFKTNIEVETSSNENFRKVIYTSKHLQLVLMTLQAQEEIGMEVHLHIDQFFRIESGSGKCVINQNEYFLKSGDVIVIPAGAKHNIINESKTELLKLYTIYTPPNHKDGTIRKTKAEAEKNSPKFDGILSE